MYRLLTEFGATPSSRSRIKADQQREEDIDELLNTGHDLFGECRAGERAGIHRHNYMSA
jgi:hypothetical protein